MQEIFEFEDEPTGWALAVDTATTHDDTYLAIRWTGDNIELDGAELERLWDVVTEAYLRYQEETGGLVDLDDLEEVND